jgi:hypothetical protein
MDIVILIVLLKDNWKTSIQDLLEIKLICFQSHSRTIWESKHSYLA